MTGIIQVLACGIAGVVRLAVVTQTNVARSIRLTLSGWQGVMGQKVSVSQKLRI